MYKKDKNITFIIFFLVSTISYVFRIDFEGIVSESIAIVAISLTVYALSLSTLANSSLVQKLINKPDKQKDNQSELDTITAYIRTGMYISVISLIFACVVKLLPTDLESAFIIELIRIFSALTFGIFTLNFFFILKIFQFFINKQLYHTN